MNPHQKNKVDISSMSPEEQRLFRMYGKLPNTKDLLSNKLKERKYFDSGDYALSKAGKASDVGVTTIGREHPNPDTIPHLSSPLLHDRTGSIVGGSIGGAPAFSGSVAGSGGGSPVKESSFLNRETSIDDVSEETEETSGKPEGNQTMSPPPHREGMPIRGAR